MDEKTSSVIVSELKKLNENMSAIAKAVETIADEIKKENSNTSSYTFKAKMVAAFERLTATLKKSK